MNERELTVLRVLDGNPQITQRQLAKFMGVSLGATNYCLKALIGKGWIKLESFQNNPSKLGYLYVLTPRGLSAKSRLTKDFLRFKMQEYERLQQEIEMLRSEMPDS